MWALQTCAEHCAIYWWNEYTLGYATDDMSELDVAIDRILGIILIAEEMLPLLRGNVNGPKKQFL